MSPFEETYLMCDLKISLIPGPRRFSEPFYSVQVDEVACYPATDVARTFSAYPGVKLLAHGGIDHYEDWFEWKWRWEHADRMIEVGFTALDPEPETEYFCWGGSELVTLCTFADLVRWWRIVQERFPAAWLHDDECRMYTPNSFLSIYALPPLQPALTHLSLTIREAARQELAVYRTLGYQGDAPARLSDLR